MVFTDEIVQVDVLLERQLLAILYDASFGGENREMEDDLVKYHIARWIMLSIFLVLAWGVELLMLLYLPIWIYLCQRDFHSLKLCLTPTPHAIVYKVSEC
ncbi:hypothetical protein ABZP36_012585 [Zizania latifolia]